MPLAPLPPSPTPFQRAIEHHRNGRLREAEALYREVLAATPRHADALHLLGVIALQSGHAEAAIELIGRAVEVRPVDNYFCNLGNAFKAQGQRREAIACYRQALALNGEMAEALSNLGNALLEQDEVDEAVACCRKAIAVKPDFAEAHNNLGNALLKQGLWDESVASYRQAVRVRPGFAVAHGNLGNALKAQGRLEEAIAECSRALQIQPDLVAAHGHLGDALLLSGREDQALDCYRRALAIGPDTAELHCKMGRVYRQQGHLDRAIHCHLLALARNDGGDVRMAFVEAIRTAHFAAPHSAVRAHVIRALEEGWAEPADLLTPATSLVEADPAIAQAIARARDAGAMARLDEALLTALASDRLLLVLLDADTLNSIALERLLTVVRRQMLDDAATGGRGDLGKPPDALFVLQAAIARQCFLNEYVYACSDDEERQLAGLHARLASCFSEGALPDQRALVASAAYAPLSLLGGAEAWAALDWPAPLAALFTQQVVEPGEERRLRAVMPGLTPIEDEVSRRVRDQYEAHPYPRWTRLPRVEAPVPFDTWLRRRFPGGPWQPLGTSGPLEVLVAGCGTGQHPIQVAQKFAQARVLAVDLSLSSLAYAQRKTTQAGLSNIEYAQADLLQLGRLARRFDVIEAAGVLHHLADPVAGLRALQELLRPGGVMVLGLYSELGRGEVIAARRRFEAQGLPAQGADIRRCRLELMHDDVAPRFPGVLSSRDFHSTSACRDLLFHVQEHRFTLPRLEEILSRLGLRLIGLLVEPEVAAAYAQRFPDDPARIDLQHWHEFETARPDTFVRMIQFCVQKTGSR